MSIFSMPTSQTVSHRIWKNYKIDLKEKWGDPDPFPPGLATEQDITAMTPKQCCNNIVIIAEQHALLTALFMLPSASLYKSANRP